MSTFEEKYAEEEAHLEAWRASGTLAHVDYLEAMSELKDLARHIQRMRVKNYCVIHGLDEDEP